MIDFIKYFRMDAPFEFGKNDCWTFLQAIFKNEHNLILPDFPVSSDRISSIRGNIILEEIKNPIEGCIVDFIDERGEHVGYAINNTHFIHKTIKGIFTQKIPKEATLYLLKGVK